MQQVVDNEAEAMAVETQLARRRFRAPAESGAVLAVPPAATWDAVWSANLARLAGDGLPVARAAARQELLQAARTYTGQYLDPPPPAATTAIVMAGHQPALIHPGVWFKNFVLSDLGQRYAATALNLIVDNDVLANAAIRVPRGTPAAPAIGWLPFDQLRQSLPFEVASVVDPACFASFGERVGGAMRPWVPAPLVRSFWPDVRAEYERTHNIGQAFAAARHRCEAAHGLQTLELPLSAICRTESFHCFAAALLQRLPELVAVHNRSLAQYRRLNRIRSQTHPVPDLRQSSESFEAPFWVWDATNPMRRHLFVRFAADELELSDHRGWSFRAPAGRLGAALGELSASGVAIRPRALVTTLYARLVLSDLFLHGIGGAKYDEITDRLAHDFCHWTPPAYLTLSATFRLPLPLPLAGGDELRPLQDRLRAIRFHPETLLAQPALTPQLADDVERKKQWIHTLEPERLAARHAALAELNRSLAAALAPLAAATQHQIEQLQQRLRARAVWGSREFASLLFPASLLEDLAAAAASLRT